MKANAEEFNLQVCKVLRIYMINAARGSRKSPSSFAEPTLSKQQRHGHTVITYDMKQWTTTICPPASCCYTANMTICQQNHKVQPYRLWHLMHETANTCLDNDSTKFTGFLPMPMF
eukprot:6474256-Amphidinium_carterae.1